MSGGEEGKVRVFDERSRTVMKTFRGHVGPVRVTSFTPDKVFVMSGGDDRSCRKWDLGTEQQIFSKTFHTDYLRCGFVLQSTPNMWLTGSYDKRVIGMDTRTQDISYSILLKNPIEAMLSYNLDGNLAVANGSSVSIFDFRVLDRGALCELSNHAKTVTSLAVSDNETRLLSGSVDQTVKIWNVESDFDCVLTQRFSAPILSVGMAPSNEFFCVGMADGLISMQHRPSKKTLSQQDEDASYARTKGHRLDHKPARGDFRVASAPRIKRSKVDALLRKFRYSEALDMSLLENESSGLTVSLISDLIDRRALDAALSGRNDSSLSPICKFISANLIREHFAEILMFVFDRILELYSVTYNQSRLLQSHFAEIKRKISAEISLETQYLELLGQVETAQAQIERKKKRDEEKLN